MRLDQKVWWSVYLNRWLAKYELWIVGYNLAHDVLRVNGCSKRWEDISETNNFWVGCITGSNTININCFPWFGVECRQLWRWGCLASFERSSGKRKKCEYWWCMLRNHSLHDYITCIDIHRCVELCILIVAAGDLITQGRRQLCWKSMVRTQALSVLRWDSTSRPSLTTS